MRFTRLTMTTMLIAIASIAACVSGDDPIAPQESGGLYVVMTRPPTVPPSYVPTPNGWFDPSCVHALADGDRVREDGRIARADGSVRPATPCNSPRYDVEGRVAEPLIAKPSTSGWIEYADTLKLGAVSYLHAQWTVPPAPAVTDATVYFFPGLENKTSLNTPILQPVLGWNQYGGPAGWSMMSWDCCTQGTYFSAAVPAAAGASVSGDLDGSGCDANGVCASWTIASHNLSTGKTTTLVASPGLAMDYVFSAVLEIYGVNTCDEVPASGVTFSGFAFSSTTGVPLAIPTWSTHVFAATPACGYFTSQTASSVTAGIGACSPGDVRDCCPYAQGCSCDGDSTCKANGQWGACVGASAKGSPCK